MSDKANEKEKKTHIARIFSFLEGYLKGRKSSF